jgi:hypothetical protein
MNPSRISTPVHKKIDEWHFKFMTKTVRCDVYIKRNRDAQANEERTPKISFEAKIEADAIVEAKIDPKQFAPATLDDFDINKLREKVEEHCRKMLSVNWEKVIVVAFNNHEGSSKETWSHGKRFGDRMNPYVNVEFDFVVAMRSGKYFRREDDEDDANYWGEDAERMLHGVSFYNDKAEDHIHVYPYDEKLLATLTLLKDRYIELNKQIAELVKPKNMPKLVASLERLLPFHAGV